jgi:polar amino acid transport system substrate-binding protein
MKSNLLVLILLIFSASFSGAEEIVLAADEWCPYNCAPDDDHPGFMIDIAKYAFAKAGHTVRYELLPWARAIVWVREGIYQGIVGAGRDETPDFIFPDIELGKATHTFYIKKGGSWKYEGVASLQAISLGVILDYSYGNLYEDYIRPNVKSGRIQVIGGKNALGLNVKKLLHGRIDALVEDAAVFQHHLYATRTPNEFIDAGVAHTEEVYIAFSPNVDQSRAYAKILTDAMIELRSTGKLYDILSKYGVNDWR